MLVALSWTVVGCLVDIPDVVAGGGGASASGGAPEGGSATGGAPQGGTAEGGGGGVVVDPDLQTLCAGPDYTCAVHDGRVFCWGSGESQVAQGATPQPVWGGASDPVEPGTLACGEHHACVLSVDGGVYCWGANAKNQLSFECGDPFDPNAQATPVPVVRCAEGVPTAVTQVTSVSLAGDSSCAALDVDGGQLGCWGAELTSGVPLAGFTAIAGIFAGTARVALAPDHGCATTPNGVVCWGAFDDGELGAGVSAPEPVLVTDQGSPVEADAVNLARDYSCALDDAALRCWGKPVPFLEGTTGDEPPTLVNAPASGIARAATGSSHACALDEQGDAACWGSDSRGQLGDAGGPAPVADFMPHAVLAPSLHWSDIAVGQSHTCARSTDDRIFCWGANDAGQLGSAGGDSDAPGEVTFP
jgi:alpha-tubulin suppressor-like RCC1 family protein